MSTSSSVASSIPALTDDEFDSLLPSELAARSAVHFTPVEVARRATALLAPAAGERVLDLGAGVGKFCIAAALARPDVTFVGVEHRAALVTVARELAGQLGAGNVELIVGDALTLDWTGYTGFYLFNPFGEHAHRGGLALDDEDVRDPDRFFRSAGLMRDRLLAVPPATTIVTYHGFGKRAPRGFDVSALTLSSGTLERWLRR